MQAVRLQGPGGADELTLDDVAVPQFGRGEALVRVHAAAITRDELEWPVDRLPAIPSYEVSGVVAEVAPDVTDVAIGDAVYALTPFDRDGAAAEYVLVPVTSLSPKPSTLSHVESAAIPMPGLTAWQGLFEHGRLEAGQRVLVHGAAGGVGHLATQLARERGAHVVTASDEGEGAPVDLVFDTVGGDLLRTSEALVRSGGRVVSVAEEPEPTRSDVSVSYFVVESNGEQLAELARLADAGRVRPAVDSVFPLAEARAAFERVQARGKHGKVVLEVAGD
jgi:NADPH:quinone reductase-like Zn-dependent oxidoreductase